MAVCTSPSEYLKRIRDAMGKPMATHIPAGSLPVTISSGAVNSISDTVWDGFEGYASPDTMRRMILERLRVPRQAVPIPFEHLHTVKVSEEKVAVLVVANKQWQVIEDDWGMFPSDQLISTLRLLMR